MSNYGSIYIEDARLWVKELSIAEGPDLNGAFEIRSSYYHYQNGQHRGWPVNSAAGKQLGRGEDPFAPE